uniref:C2H2-type domain-containing protein n=1 Tax=Amphimedon queenslandica TaxID=400682 RepID=A0A1X7UBD0_AMPQE
MTSGCTNYCCSICKHFSSANYLSVLRHIGVVHSHEANFSLTCGVNGCIRNFCNYYSFRKHLRRLHPDVFSNPTTVTSASQVEVTIDESDDNIDEDEVSDDRNAIPIENPGDVCQSHSQSAVISSKDEERSFALFLLKTKEMLCISQKATDEIMNDVIEIVYRFSNNIGSEVGEILKKNGINLENIRGLDCALNKMYSFEKLRSKFMQNKYYESNFGLVPVSKVKLGSKLKRQLQWSNSHFAACDENCYIVPLLESLKQLLSNDFIFNDAYKDHLLFQDHPNALQIMLYYDDVEVCNPIGSKAKIHKLGLFYYTLGNLSPKYRSSMVTIQLVAIVKYTLLQRYGHEAILRPFIDDVKALESDAGVTLWINGKSHTIHGTVSVMAADNLASWSIGGYKTLASAKRKCRFCMATSDDFKTKFSFEEFTPRNCATHLSHIADLNGPFHNHISTTYGIFMSQMDLPAPDIMHDVLEGALEYELKELLKYVTMEMRLMSCDEHNNIIDGFPYGYTDSKNKASNISQKSLLSIDHNLKQNATQIWYLARLLPLMIGEHIPVDNDNWNNFMLLVTIVDYIFAPLTSDEISSYVAMLLKEHHERFTELYPNSPIIPKMHYMIHLPEWMRRYGPPSRYWCMRFEAKHKYFKNLTHIMKNFKNVPKSLAARHQARMCYQLSGSNPFKNLNIGTVKKMLFLGDYAHADVIKTKDSYLTFETSLNIVSWIEIDGSNYKQGAVVILESDLLPLFAIIEDIVLYNSTTVVFVVQKLVTDCFNSHFYSYEVLPSYPLQFVACEYTDFKDSHNSSITFASTHIKSNQFTSSALNAIKKVGGPSVPNMANISSFALFQ